METRDTLGQSRGKRPVANPLDHSKTNQGSYVQVDRRAVVSVCVYCVVLDPDRRPADQEEPQRLEEEPQVELGRRGQWQGP